MSKTLSFHVSFHVSKADHRIILKIANRAMAIGREKGVVLTKMATVMDITATHANGYPLDLKDLLAAKNLDFIHDVFGIRRHLDRSTGKLGDCFVPRYARRTARAA